MAGLLYLPRLFVYHAECEANTQQSQTFMIMERRLLKAIMTPSMVISWILGLTLLLVFDVAPTDSSVWFHVKLGLVVMLSIFHMYLGKLVREFAQNNNQHSAKFYRLINEVPTVLMIAIVIMVIVRPF